MKKYERKTVDRWDIETNYGYGWEAEYSIYDHKKAKQIYKDYVKNCRCAVRLTKHREKLHKADDSAE